MNKFWKMTKNSAKNSAEISIYGEIGASWWGESITPKQFSKDLKDLGDDLEEITVLINSPGGGVFDGLTIRSLLKNHQASITVRIEGYAASIASIIAMAGDKIVMSKGSMMMIHNPATSLWGGESKDFREVADFLDQIRDSLLPIYSDRTGLSNEELIEMMDKETWMSADEAVEKGFADEVEDGAVSASMMGAVATVNGVNMDLSKFMNAPKLEQEKPKVKNTTPTNQKEGKKAKVNNAEELKNEYPDIYNQVIQQGAEQERTRIEALDTMNKNSPGNEEIINKAKYETFDSAETTAMEILNHQAAKRENHLKNLQKDVKNSGLKSVIPQDPPNNEKTEDEQAKEKGSLIASAMNKIRGGNE
ncbi:head maturation protease, ClpP-related [Chengkuizengella axinellae]|uniref:ATP-dependent Clp protease proteolytic subunit n=1 Tax=Chengkuizengella axinellae TaxID=3064388 RepID=A0ABT9J6A2_9BACL|nr:head maturation protease, ClpP-related [Chengkuizengella sp. 2205SS18-9]MDP5277151.1 Clp protease ClpP [Chengkuizengella sp. 2205SS18-9]